MWQSLISVGLWIFQFAIKQHGFSEDQKQAFINFVQAMSKDNDKAAKLWQDYQDELEEIRLGKPPK